MTQGFTQNLPTPVPITKGGSGSASGNLALMNGTSIGTTTNDNAAAGLIGEFQSSVIAFASAVGIATATATNLTSLSLTAGDWDVYGNINFVFSANNGTEADAWISTTSASVPDQSLRSLIVPSSGILGTAGVHAPFKRISIASTTTVYLTGYATFGSGTCSMNGGLFARRAR